MQTNIITLAMTGASGMPYGLRLLECLIQANKRIYLVMSSAARVVLTMEMGLELPHTAEQLQAFLSNCYQAEPGQLTVFSSQQWSAPIASGSAAVDAMVICPCSSGCVGAIANGMSDNLIERAADVVLKEQRRLILVHRETPLSAIHLENLLKLARLGVSILPANPGFYHQPQSVTDLVDFVVARILDQLQIPQQLIPPWGS